MKTLVANPIKALTALALFACVAAHGRLEAAVLVNVDFDNGYTVGTIDGQTGSGTTGLAGTWSVNGSGLEDKVKIVAADPRLNYTVAGGGTINAGTQAVKITYTGSGHNDLPDYNLAGTALSSSISGQNVFIGMVFLNTGYNTANQSMYMVMIASDVATPSGWGIGVGVFKGYLEAGANATIGGPQPPYSDTAGEPIYNSSSPYITGANLLVAEYV